MASKTHQELEEIWRVKLTTTFPWWSQAGKQPNTRPEALDDRKQTKAVGDHELRVETELPERLQPFMEGKTRGFFKFDRRISSWRGNATASTSSFSKTYCKQIRTKAHIVDSFFQRPEVRSMQMHAKLRERCAKQILTVGWTE